MTTMHFDPDAFADNSDIDGLPSTQELIRLIKDNTKGEKINTIVDIGCGPGANSRILAQELNVEHIVGIDIDPKMVEFAKDKNMLKNTDYYTQDISCDWNEWNDSLRQLAGKVSVIFSNFTLHWIQDWEALERTTQNLSTLLSDSGIMVFQLLYVGDIYRTVSSEDRLKYEQWLKYPAENEVIGQWMTTLKRAGMSHFDIKFYESKTVYPKEFYINDWRTEVAIQWYKTYLKPTVTDVNIDDLLKDLVIKDRAKTLTEKSPKGEELIEITLQLWNFVVKK